MSMSTPPNQHNPNASESVHDVWRRQRAVLEHELFDSGADEDRRAGLQVARTVRSIDPGQVGKLPHVEDAAKVQHAEWLRLANDAAAKQRLEQQQRYEQELARQREAFQQDLGRRRVAFEQELAARELAWAAQRDQEWTALRNAKEIQDVTIQKLKDELAVQRVSERDELHQWRRQAETELVEARRLFEQDRLQQLTEFARQREVEVERLRRDREEIDANVRQTQAELTATRQRQEEELRQTRDAHVARMQTERAELEKLRDGWTGKFRREQVVLENGLQFFEQHLLRVSDELKSAQRGLQAVSMSAGEVSVTMPLSGPCLAMLETPIAAKAAHAPPATSRPLNLEEIRERLLQLKTSERQKAA